MKSSAMLVSGLLLALFYSSCVSAQTRDLQAVSTISQTSISWNRSVTGGDPLAKLQFNDSRLANTAGGLDPSQVSDLAVRTCVRVPRCQSCLNHYICLHQKSRNNCAVSNVWLTTLERVAILHPQQRSRKQVPFSADSLDLHWCHQCDCVLGHR